MMSRPPDKLLAPSPSRAGRPRDLRKRQAIIEAGLAHFLRDGVGATKLEQVARAAGVSKVTLYAYFPDKAALFEAAIGERMAMIEAAQALRADPAPLRERLERFGHGILQFLHHAEAVEFYNVLAGELRRHPDLARRFYDNGPGKTRANLTALIGAAHAAGELTVADPAAAAEELFGLWLGFSQYALALGMTPAGPSLERRVTRGVEIFLEIYRADKPDQAH